ncbi:MAG: hypothetical protein ABFR82_11405 [Nitrospirota bacterium]
MITKEIAESQTLRTALVFGEIAVKAGFLTPGQLDNALAIQRDFITISNDRTLKRIGDIIFEKGWMNVEQIYKVQIDVFNQMCEVPAK